MTGKEAFPPPHQAVRTRIRTMVKADIGHAGEILFKAFNTGASKYGYTPRINSVQEGISWAWALFRHAPAERLIAEVDNRSVGICCLSPRGEQGGVGPVAVDPSFQGGGIGRQLISALLERAQGLSSVRLFQEAFNPGSFSLYCSFNFVPVADLLDVFLMPAPGRKTPRSDAITEATAGDLDALHRYDSPRSKMDRRTDLAYFSRWGRILVCRTGSQIRGYLACLPGLRSVQLGPLVADGEEEAARLFLYAAAAFSTALCQARVMASDQTLVSALFHSGFELYCHNRLMVRGSWRPGRSIEAYGRFPEGA